VEPLRLAIVTPRFWPLVDEGPAHLLELAAAMLAAGHRVRVVSALWKRDWPPQMLVGRVPLVRLRGAPHGAWGTLRWIFSLARWLGSERERLDGALVAGLGHEAYVAVSQLQPAVPVVVIAGESDLARHGTGPLGGRIAARCREARGCVAGSDTLARLLEEQGFPRDRVHTIRQSVSIPPPTNQQQRALARAALAGANYDLVTTEAASVAIAVGRLDADHRLGDLVRAWRIVAARRPEARLWIVGDGPQRERLYRQVGDLDLRFRVLLPGTFDCLDELWQAADMFVVPAPRAVPPRAMLQAMAAGVPVVAADGAGLREAIVPGETGLVFPPGDVKELAAAIERLIERPAEGRALGAAGRAGMQSAPGLADEAAQYAALFSRLRSPVQPT
jgi:glycosyltransferase involved in cell wall biosynthesis